MRRIGLFGGIYNNHLALSAAIDDAVGRGLSREDLFCLGDLGGFGPNPDRTVGILRENNISIVQGNYDHSIGNELEDCQCGYTDPRDNYFAQVSYEYTLKKTSADHKRFMKTLRSKIRLEVAGCRVLLCHGSPRFTNEFLWESTSPTYFLEKLCDDFDADIICATHTGIKWHRKLSGDRRFVNVGVLGRPENDGTKRVWYSILEVDGKNTEVRFIPVEYDYENLAKEMAAEKIPCEFIETIRTGHWTTCLEILPAKERCRGRY